MQIINKKSEEDLISKENKKLARIDFTSNDTLVFIMSDGTKYNFNDGELKMIYSFFDKIDFQYVDFKRKN